MILRAALLAALLASPAAAQTTQCVYVGNGVTNCRQSGPPSVAVPAPQYYQPSNGPSTSAMLLGAYLSGRKDRQAKAQAEKDAEHLKAIKGSVGYYVGEGRCDEAVKVAADAGNLDLAAQARTACVPR